MEYGDIYGYRIYLQPQIQLDNGRLSGVEALIRGIGENGTLINPEAFLPAMERKGQIMKLDYFMMAQVCGLLKRWHNSRSSIVPVSINLSRQTIGNSDALGSMLDLCQKASVRPDEIVVEITERGEADMDIAEAASQWKKAGFALSLDDYGAGLSNTRTLLLIPFDELKIDQSLTVHINRDRKTDVIVKAVVEMCKEIGGIRCIAEGIERESQVRFLRELGCGYGQGFYFYRPMPVYKFEALFLPRNVRQPTSK